MFANGQTLLVVATFVVANAHVIPSEESKVLALDDIVGAEYVDQSEVKAAKVDMLARGDGYGTNWIVMPDGDGIPEIAVLSVDFGNNKSKSGLDRTIFSINTPPEEAVTFRLFTRSDPKLGVPFKRSNLDNVNFDPSKLTKFIIHGWMSSIESSIVTNIRDAYLTTSDVNVIAVDWSGPAKNVYYPASASYTKQVGAHVGDLMDDLVVKKAARYEHFHAIGHSLGAHTAGIAGFSTRESIARVTGLDPALPGFQDLASREDSLDYTDADFVDVIHTCAGSLGMSSPIGHADFYPNGGSPFQPGCCCIIELTGTCSHGRSHEYFAESILSKKAFEGIRCNSWNQFQQDSCDDFVVPMGEYTPPETRGVFYLETGSQSPFGRGSDGTKCTQSK